MRKIAVSVGAGMLAGLAIVASGAAPPGAGGSAAAGPGANGAGQAEAIECPPLPRGAEALVEPGGFVVVGEVHGTAEAPAFVAALACAAARRAGARGLVVGIEMSHADQPALDAFSALDAPEAARRELLAAAHFTDRWRDGRDSVAVVSLLEDLRRWRRAGLAITAVAFDVAADEELAGGAREAAMAERIAAAIERHSGASVLVHTGNVHSRTVQGVPWDPELVPMAARLRGRHPHLRAVNFARAGGSAWVCIAKTAGAPPECGEHAQRGVDRGAEPFVELWDEPDDTGHDGIYYLGLVSASPPATAD